MSDALSPLQIQPFENTAHRAQVIALWKTALGYEAAHNRPDFAIDQKIRIDDGLFFVALLGPEVVGTTMAGYDGHRGWLYSVAVHPDHRRQGIGACLVRHAERALAAKGCVKINLQISAGNERVSAFYATLGYTEEPRVSMGKLVRENLPLPAR